MKTITLRNIPTELARKLEEKARRQGLSLSRTVIAMLEESAGLRKGNRPTLHHDLDSLAGTWTEEEGRAFERALKDQRKIDADLWR